ncbi:MAG: hypothetical protein ACP5D6_04355 [Kosmotogaceae bacterium]
MLEKVEAYFMKEFSEKAGRLAIFSLFLLIPDYRVRLFFIFLLITSLLPSDMQNKKMSNLLVLPFSYSNLFWYSYIFLIAVVSVTEFIGAGLFGVNIELMSLYLLGSVIFATAYYAIAVLSVTAGLDNFGIPLLIFMVDLIAGGVGNRLVSGGFNVRWSNPYYYISPIHQGNVFIVSAVAAGLLIVSYIMLLKKGVQK